MIREAILNTSELLCLSQVGSYLGGTGLQGPVRQIGFKGRGAGPFGIWCMWPGTTLYLGALLPCFGAMVPQLPSLGGPWSGLICAQQDHRGMAIST